MCGGLAFLPAWLGPKRLHMSFVPANSTPPDRSGPRHEFSHLAIVLFTGGEDEELGTEWNRPGRRLPARSLISRHRRACEDPLDEVIPRSGSWRRPSSHRQEESVQEDPAKMPTFPTACPPFHRRRSPAPSTGGDRSENESAEPAFSARPPAVRPGSIGR